MPFCGTPDLVGIHFLKHVESFLRDPEHANSIAIGGDELAWVTQHF